MKNLLIALIVLGSCSAFARQDLGVSVGDKVSLNDITVKYNKELLVRVAIFSDGDSISPENKLLVQSECVVSVTGTPTGTRIPNKLINLESTVTKIESDVDSEVRLYLKINSIDGLAAKQAIAQIHCMLGASGLFNSISAENIIYNIGQERINIGQQENI